ncbi:retrotransposon protein, putative, ty3-gypsy subclass [Tanacetum coccineum]
MSLHDAAKLFKGKIRDDSLILSTLVLGQNTWADCASKGVIRLVDLALSEKIMSVIKSSVYVEYVRACGIFTILPQPLSYSESAVIGCEVFTAYGAITHAGRVHPGNVVAVIGVSDVGSRNKKEHEEHLKAILELLKKEELYAKLSKCEFWIPKGDKQEASFQTLKHKLCSAPILALPQGAENFIVYCDASHKGLGAVLMQNENVIMTAEDS